MSDHVVRGIAGALTGMIKGPMVSAPTELSPRLFSFIWKYSARDQLTLLLWTLLSFPILYFSLTLPKLILNGAIEGQSSALDDYLPTMDQVSLLWLLSCLLLALIIANGFLKMQLNIYRGMVGERLIRRLRFAMIDRAIDLPARRVRRLSQGEAVSMITAESEPLTGVMGDAFAQPLFQLGQMVTILAFLFIQNVWLGLAGVSLIPVQAYLIPRMQREVNKLQRARVAEVRRLSETIGESIAGASALRLHGGRRYRLAQFSDRLQRMFAIRVRIFRKKFLIKFINNLLTQITPFLFYVLGGYLVIMGQLSIGALVAAIAASRDIAEPWRELLLYWNQAQEASSRYGQLMRQFGNRATRKPSEPSGTPSDLKGDIHLANVGARSLQGATILEQIDLNLPAGSFIGLEVRDDLARQALVDLITGERDPDVGTVTLAGRDVRGLPLDLRSTRIGVANSTPFIFRASVAENIRMPLFRAPGAPGEAIGAEQREALRTGNSADRIDVPWASDGIGGLAGDAAIEQWWLQIIDAMGAADLLLERALDVWLMPARNDALASALILRQPAIVNTLDQDGLLRDVERFAPDRFNASLSIGENLLFAVRRWDQDDATLAGLLAALNRLDIAPTLVSFAVDLAAVLARAFGEVGGDHPLLRRLTSLRPTDFEEMLSLSARLETEQPDILGEDDRCRLLALLFKTSARDLGSTVPSHLAALIVDARPRVRDQLGDLISSAFEPLVPGRYNYSLTIFENLLGGTLRVRNSAQRPIRKAVIDLITDEQLRGRLRLLIGDVDPGADGERLGVLSRERLAVARAVIRRPDLLILDHAMASLPISERERMWQRLRDLLPECTVLVVEPEFSATSGLDQVFRIREGQLESARGATAAPPPPQTLLSDQADKFAALSKVFEFRGLRRAQLELLAYASELQHYKAGAAIFSAGEATDGVYVVTSGSGELRFNQTEYQHTEIIDEVLPGRMIGDLSVLLDRPRLFSLVAVTELSALRIGEREFRDILEGDIGVALQLLRRVSEHLSESVNELGLSIRR